MEPLLLVAPLLEVQRPRGISGGLCGSPSLTATRLWSVVLCSASPGVTLRSVDGCSTPAAAARLIAEQLLVVWRPASLSGQQDFVVEPLGCGVKARLEINGLVI